MWISGTRVGRECRVEGVIGTKEIDDRYIWDRGDEDQRKAGLDGVEREVVERCYIVIGDRKRSIGSW